MKKKIVILVILFNSIILWSNGGPINVSSIIHTGNLQLINKHDIKLKEELLEVKLIGDYAQVSVRYSLMNKDSIRNVLYGFPIDVAGFTYKDQGQEKLFGVMDLKDNIEGYTIKLNNNVLEYQIQKEENYDSIEKIFHSINIKLREWFITELDLESGENILEITYKVKSMLKDDYYTGSVLSRYSNRYFSYLLSPSGYWGDGTVDNFKFKLDISELRKIGGQLVRYPDGGKWIDNDNYEFNFINYNLKDINSIEIEYVNKSYYLTDEISNLIKNHNGTVKGIEVSSELSSTNDWNYSKDNLLDMNFDSAWVEGVNGNGINEKISIYFNEDTRLSYLGIINGFLYSEKTYRENSRIKDLEVKVYLIDDSMSDNHENIEYVKNIHLQDLPYVDYNSEYFGGFVQTIFDTNGFYAPIVTMVELTILNAYAGDKYNDLCISELLLGSYP